MTCVAESALAGCGRDEDGATVNRGESQVRGQAPQDRVQALLPQRALDRGSVAPETLGSE